MLSVKQGGIEYHFKSLWYDSTWDWTQVSRAIGEHSNRWANVPVDDQYKWPQLAVNIWKNCFLVKTVFVFFFFWFIENSCNEMRNSSD